MAEEIRSPIRVQVGPAPGGGAPRGPRFCCGCSAQSLCPAHTLPAERQIHLYPRGPRPPFEASLHSVCWQHEGRRDSLKRPQPKQRCTIQPFKMDVTFIVATTAGAIAALAAAGVAGLLIVKGLNSFKKLSTRDRESTKESGKDPTPIFMMKTNTKNREQTTYKEPDKQDLGRQEEADDDIEGGTHGKVEQKQQGLREQVNGEVQRGQPEVDNDHEEERGTHNGVDKEEQGSQTW